MCVVSMVYDHYGDKWEQWKKSYPQPMPVGVPPPYTLPPTPVPAPSTITPEEVAEFRKLLERAREYDKRHNEPDCELEEELGVKIDFI